MDLEEIADYKNSLYELANDMKCDDEIIYDIKDNFGIMEALMFFWQQNSRNFNENVDDKCKDFMLSYFKDNNNKKFYKGVHFPKGEYTNNIWESAMFTSTTDNIDVAASFAIGWRNSFLDTGYDCYIFEVEGTKVLENVSDFRDMGEDEIIVYNPKFSAKPIIKIESCIYNGVERLPTLEDMEYTDYREDMLNRETKDGINKMNIF